MPATDDTGEEEPKRDVGREMNEDSSTMSSILGDIYRGELDRETTWRSRLDQTTTWGVTVMAAILTWGFSSPDNPHYIILIGLFAVTMFLLIEARRYRHYDIYRSRVRLLQENLLVNVLDPTTETEEEDWRTQLSEDYREPTIKTGTLEALSIRLRRVYLLLLTLMVLAWVFRITAFVPSEEWLETAAIVNIPGFVTISIVGAFYLIMAGITFWPHDEGARSEFREKEEEGGD